MKIKSKKNLRVLFLIGSALASYYLWLSLRPVDIVAVHEDGNFSSVLVKNFPITDKGKISWWLKNKDMLKTKYNIPKSASYGNFTITFWLFGDGYKKEGKYDRLCFNDMKKEINCIEKKAVFSVNNDSKNRVIFTVYDGTYLMKKNGEIVKYEYK
ncbi:DUF943 family protein [Brenneria sp. g21c3]|uniref:DUF943 family protein n=1 Tax=Brenneria sp. g21c3 TaxID=3093893 RepID=UPI002EBBD0E7|nr:DUF943 family protein [Brenneria sp. g21c3]